MLRDSQNNMSQQLIYLSSVVQRDSQPASPLGGPLRVASHFCASFAVCVLASVFCSGPPEVNHTSSPLPHHHHLYRILFWGTLLPAKPSPIRQPDLPDSPPNKGARNLRPLCVRERSNTHTPAFNNINRFAFAFHSLPRVRLKGLHASFPPILHPHIRFKLGCSPFPGACPPQRLLSSFRPSTVTFVYPFHAQHRSLARLRLHSLRISRSTPFPGASPCTFLKDFTLNSVPWRVSVYIP
jgi:hypothetical protein